MTCNSSNLSKFSPAVRILPCTVICILIYWSPQHIAQHIAGQIAAATGSNTTTVMATHEVVTIS